MAAFLLVLACLAGCAVVEAGKWNGCWKDGVYDISIPNCTPNPPVGLCAACPLIVDNVYDEGALKG